MILFFDKNCIRCLEHDTGRKPISPLAEWLRAYRLRSGARLLPGSTRSLSSLNIVKAKVALRRGGRCNVPSPETLETAPARASPGPGFWPRGPAQGRSGAARDALANPQRRFPCPAWALRRCGKFRGGNVTLALVLIRRHDHLRTDHRCRCQRHICRTNEGVVLACFERNTFMSVFPRAES